VIRTFLGPSISEGISILTRSIDTGAFALSRPLSAAIAWAAGKGEGRLDTNVRELTVITLISLFSLGLAWGHEADLFAMFFAAAAAIAAVAAVRRSL
jgi:hypothetical protein